MHFRELFIFAYSKQKKSNMTDIDAFYTRYSLNKLLVPIHYQFY